jgi:hypothetical protein
MIVSLSFTSAGAQALADEGIGVNVLDDPAPIYPDLWESVFTKTPTFRFTQYNDVTKYRITVTMKPSFTILTKGRQPVGMGNVS